MITKHWCVRHNDGWCAAMNNVRPKDAAFNVETACGWYVVLPLGIKLRKPTCPECLTAIEKLLHPEPYRPA